MGEIDYKEIGNRIRVARIASNLTREEAAERCGVTSSYYGNLERGDRRMSLDTLVRVSEGLDLSLDLLVYGKGKEGKDELSAMLSEILHRYGEKQLERYLEVIRALRGIADKL